MELAGQPMHPPQHIYGIDFSGAQDAGKKIWIAEGVVKTDLLLIEDCFMARDLQGSGNELDICLLALKDFIKENQDAAFGLDFPFGLSYVLVKQESWKEFIIAFPNLYDGPDHFRQTSFSNAGNRELKRKTDEEAETPFSPYNLRIFKQTYYGISEILHPLIQNNHACVLPMQKPAPKKPWIIEICPASTLQSLKLYHLQYKGRTDQHRHNRWEILQEIVRIGPIHIDQPEICRKIIEDTGGDALDSVIAAMATFRALKNNVPPPKEWRDFWNIEGYVYV